MKSAYCTLMLLCVSTIASAQSEKDSSDIYYQHLNLDEVIVTSPVGQIKRKESTTPITVVSEKTLQQTSSTNIIDAVAKQPGVSQVTTGSGISKPVIRGLGYNRIVTVADGIRQEGQQWGDEHGIELDGQGIGQVEILKGPASLMYGSDAMAGVIIFHPEAIEAAGHMGASVGAEYQTNSGLINYSLRFGGNKKGFVWNARYSEKLAHAYKNRYDGYVPGTQFHERAAKALVGFNKSWGFSHLTLGYYHLTPSMTEGERDEKTGELKYDEDQYPNNNLKTYHKALPYQQIHHYKAVLDNSFALGGGTLKAIIGYQHNRRQEFEGHHHHHHESETGTSATGTSTISTTGTSTESGEEHNHEAHADGSTPNLDFLLHTLTYDLRYAYNVFDGWRLNAGVGGMYQNSSNKGEEYLIPAYNLFDFGFFATAAKNLKQWTLSGGLRFDNRHLHSHELWEHAEEHDATSTTGSSPTLRFADFTRNYSALSGSVGAVYHATPDLNLRANIAHGFRAPNLSELSSNGVHHGTIRYEIGNNDLQPEHSWQGDLGLDYNHRYFTLEAALFLNRISDYIYAESVPQAEMAAYPQAVAAMKENASISTFRYTQGTALLKGFEVGIDVHPIHQLHIGSTFSMVDARLLDHPIETRYLPLTPAPRLTGDVKWEFLHNGDHHTTAAHHLGKDNRHNCVAHILDNAFVGIGVEYNFRQNHYYMANDTETATPSYALLNLTAGTDILLRGKKKLCEVYLIANNLLDCAYQSHLSRLKYTDVNNVTGRRGIYNPGRNITIKVRFPFRW